jgi:hypothetical protein
MKQRFMDPFIVGVVVSLLGSRAVDAQPLNPSYLAEMPPAARVMAEIKGKDAEDTGERQMGAFQALVQIMDEMAWGIGHRYVNDADTTALTPDERRIRLAYQTAYADLWHKVTKKDAYQHDRDLLNEVLKKLFPEDLRALYFKSNANAAKGYKAFHERMYANPANTASSQPPTNQTAVPGGKAEMRRCLASGRSTRICFTEVMGNGVEQLTGMSLKEPVATGLRMTGDYAGAGGFRLIFEPEQATMVCRGVPAPGPYTVQITDTQALITVQHQSKPVVFSLGPDGRLTGSGPIRVTGQVPAGSRTEQTMGTSTRRTTTTRELTPLEAQNYPNARENATRNGQTYTVQQDASELVWGPTGTQTVTQFVTKSADCTLGPMSAVGASPLPHLPKNDLEVLTTIGAGLGTLMKGGNVNDATKEMLFPDAEKNIAPGLRMNGSYVSSTGFSLNFHRESVTAGCGDAERALEYSVQRARGKTTLAIKDNPNPISLQLMPDGSITGEGSVQVNGRVITGTTDDANNPFVFAPHVARCAIGRLVAGSSAPRPAAVAPSAAPQSASTADAGSRAVSPGGTSLRISAGPGVAHLLAGKALIVLKDNLENVLAASGIGAQGRSSRVSAWAHACEASTSDPICQQGVKNLGNYMVAKTGFDANGTAIFNNVPRSGTFCVVAETSYTHHLLWNLTVELKPGASAITLDERNQTPIDR